MLMSALLHSAMIEQCVSNCPRVVQCMSNSQSVIECMSNCPMVGQHIPNCPIFGQWCVLYIVQLSYGLTVHFHLTNTCKVQYPTVWWWVIVFLTIQPFNSEWSNFPICWTVLCKTVQWLNHLIITFQPSDSYLSNCLRDG